MMNRVHQIEMQSLSFVSLSLKNTFTTYQVFLKAVRTLGRADETVCIEVKLYVLFHDKGSQTVTILCIVQSNHTISSGTRCCGTTYSMSSEVGERCISNEPSDRTFDPRMLTYG